MTKKKNNCKSTKVKCDVESCKFQNDEEGICELEEVQISCDCDNDECGCNEETICESFESAEEKDEHEEEDIDIDSDEDDDK